MKKYTELLKEIIQIKSVSTDPKFKGEIDKAVEWLKNLFDKNKFKTEIFKGYDNPVVFANYVKDKKLPTCLIYGHYDVQPADIKDGWDNDPFRLTEKDGKLYARGVADNKGQFLVHLYSIIDLIKSRKLKYNIKFLIEGNEETGSGGITKLIPDQKEKFTTDYIMISDGEMPYKPVITASFRGTFNLTVRYKTSKNNLHSGLYGGAVPNASIELSKFVSKIYDDDYNTNIKDFYKDMKPITKKELTDCKKMDKSKEELLSSLGIERYFLGKNKSFCSKVGFISMLTVSGFKSGYIGEGYSNIVPNSAEVRFNFRLAAEQDPNEILEIFKEFVRKNTPKYVDYEIIEPEETVKPIKVDVKAPKQIEVIKLLKRVYKEDVLIDYCGATLPIVVDFKKVLGIDPLLVSLANDDCNMHGVNENYDIGLIKKGLEFSRKFFSKS